MRVASEGSGKVVGKKRKGCRVFILLISLLIFSLVSAGAEAFTWTVTDVVDNPASPGEWSLRGIVQWAFPGDTILFADGKRDISLLEPLVTEKMLRIQGPASLTQTGSSAVLVNTSPTIVTISGVTFSGATDKNMSYAGSGVINWGVMRLTDCVMTSNRTAWQGAGVSNTGTLEMVNCVVRNNVSNKGGGGVFSSGTLVMTGCTVENNICIDDAGGGILNDRGTLEVRQSFILGNIANSALTNDDMFMGTNSGDGGGISNMGGTVKVIDSTISGNAGYWGGGIYIGYDFGSSSLQISGSTISGNTAEANGGGIYSFRGTVTVENSRIQLNTAALSYSYGHGGGISLSESTASLLAQSSVSGNLPDQIYCSYGSSYTNDGTCTVGGTVENAPPMLPAPPEENLPEPRDTSGEPDITALANDLENPESDIFKRVKEVLSADLDGLPGGLSATLHDTFAYEDVPLSDDSGNGVLPVEFTASWPERIRYYMAFGKYDDGEISARSVKGYDIPERGIQLEVRPGQSLPEGVEAPEYYEEGDGLMTWRNVIADNGPYDQNRDPGVVTVRVAEIQAEAEEPSSGSSGCSAGGSAAAALLLTLPLVFLVGGRKKN